MSSWLFDSRGVVNSLLRQLKVRSNSNAKTCTDRTVALLYAVDDVDDEYRNLDNAYRYRPAKHPGSIDCHNSVTGIPSSNVCSVFSASSCKEAL